MRTLVLLVVVAFTALIYFAVVLRLPSARGLLRTMLRLGWIWVAVIVVLGAFEAYRQWT